MDTGDPTPGSPHEPPLSEEETDLLRRGLLLAAIRAFDDPREAEEVVQESLARALEAVRDGRAPGRDRLGGYVRGILRHVIADHWRRKADERGAVGGGDVPDRRDSALEDLVSGEERARVRAALADLSDPDREILRLVYYDRLTSAEIARRSGEAEATVRKRKSRAMERLRRAFRRAEGSRKDARIDYEEEGGVRPGPDTRGTTT